MAWVTITDYAQKRGVSRQRISTLVHEGRLKGATRTVGKRIQVDPGKADSILAKTIDPSWEGQAKLAAGKKSGGNGKAAGGNGRADAGGQGEPTSGGIAFNEAKRLHELAKAGLKKLELEEKSGKLVRAVEVEAAAFNRARAVRDGMLNIPDRVAPILAAETDVVKVAEILSREIRQALEELSR